MHWEHLSYVYDRLDSTPSQRLEGEETIYGKGMWAGSLRFHQGTFYLCFVANDTHRTYLYTAKDPAGPWEKHPMEGFYHDCSLLFDDDGRVYIAYGNREIRITELKEDLSGPKEGGLDRIAVSEKGNAFLSYEGTHFYRIGGRYFLFFIHSLPDRWRRVEACYAADSIDGEFTGGDVFNDDLGYCGQGVAQGGIVDTPEGAWYAVLFQDRGACGRIPVLLPVRWQDGRPVLGDHGRMPADFALPAVPAAPLTQSDDFTTSGDRQSHGTFGLKSCWQFNHEPDLSLTRLDADAGTWTVTTGKLCRDLSFARNTITQRMRFPGCAAEVTLDASRTKPGDTAGLCALQGCYAFIGLTRDESGFRLTMRGRPADNDSLQPLPEDALSEQVFADLPWPCARAELRAEVDFDQMKDEVVFLARRVPEDRTAPEDGQWLPVGRPHRLYFKTDHFTSCRFGLFLYATQETGGSASFSRFIYAP